MPWQQREAILLSSTVHCAPPRLWNVRAWATEDTSTLASAAIMEDTSSDHLVFACACVIFYMLGVARVRACKTQAAICLILEQQRL